MKLGEVDFSLPPAATSYSIKVQPSNISTVVSPTYTATASQSPLTGLTFPSQTLFFDIPAGASPSVFIDTRFSTLSFRATYSVVTAGTSSVLTTGFQRSGGYSYFDRTYVTAQNGNIVEDINEFGLVNDLLTSLQLNPATRDSLALQYGFLTDAAALQSQGHAWAAMTTTMAAGQIESHSYSMPLISSLIGVTADKFLNIGRTSKLQFALQTATELPISLTTGTATSAGTFIITLSDFALNLEYIDIGAAALAMLDSTLVDRKAYIHGVTYKTSSVSMPAVSGTQSLLAGIRGSSVKSLFTRFYDQGTNNATNSYNGKYDSKSPSINNINYNIGGLRFPNNPVNPLLQPAVAFRNLQMAIGAFNNSQFQSCIIPSAYCKLSAGGTAQALTVGATQDYYWNLGTAAASLAQFIYGENLEICARRGLMSGLNCQSAPVFVELNTSAAPTNAQQVYVIAMLDCVYIHDVANGDIQVRI
jgi:hypothetical protein